MNMNSKIQTWKYGSNGLRAELFTFAQWLEKDELRKRKEKKEVGELGDMKKKEEMEKDDKCQKLL